VKTQTGVKNRICAVLARNNIIHSSSDIFGKRERAFIHVLLLPEVYRTAIDGYLSVPDELE